MADPRSSSAKMIAERLRVAAMPPTSAHLDADLLTAFAERSLSERERSRVIEHLAHCAVCRDVVYLAQPEMEAPSLATAASPAPLRWFAWRRLQWAALAASVSLVVALAVLVRESPQRSVLTGRMANEPNSPQTVAQSQARNDATTSLSNYDSSYAVNAERREQAPALGEKPAKLKAEATQAEALGQKGVHRGADSNGYFETLSPGVARSATDDLQKTANSYDKEATKKDAYTFRVDEKDSFITDAVVNGTTGVRTASGAPSSRGEFPESSQQASGGPAANMNAQNSIQNNTNNRLYRDRLDQFSKAATSQPAPAPPPPAAAGMATADLKVQPTPSAEQGATMGGPVTRQSTPTRAVVPAEDARKKKLETIPAHATPPGTEETVAVAGKVQDVDAARTETPSTVSENETRELPLNGRDSLSLMTVSAITDWRVRHGRLQGRLYGIWHDLILRMQPGAGDNSVTEVSSASESNIEPEAKSRSATRKEKVGSVFGGLAVALQRFTSVAKSGANVWAVEVVGGARTAGQLIVHHSQDAGITWQPSVLTTQETLNPNAEAGIRFKDAQQGEISLSSGERWQTTDGGEHWNSVK